MIVFARLRALWETKAWIYSCTCLSFVQNTNAMNTIFLQQYKGSIILYGDYVMISASALLLFC